MIKQTEDAKLLTALLHESFAQYALDTIPSSALKETPESIEQLLLTGTEAYVYLLNQRPVGTVRTTIEGQALMFSRLGVLPQYRNRGIARALITFVEEKARHEKRPLIRCGVRKKERSNIALYERLGYSIVNEEVSPRHEEPLIIVTMEKQLF